jgi:hypothetical protein
VSIELETFGGGEASDESATGAAAVSVITNGDKSSPPIDYNMNIKMVSSSSASMISLSPGNDDSRQQHHYHHSASFDGALIDPNDNQVRSCCSLFFLFDLHAFLLAAIRIILNHRPSIHMSIFVARRTLLFAHHRILASHRVFLSKSATVPTSR